MITTFSKPHLSEQIPYWIPPLISGLIAFLLFTLLGHAPLLRAGAMSIAVIGVTASLRSLGKLLCIVGGLSFALSPISWSQTSGNLSVDSLSVGYVLVFAFGVAIITFFLINNRALYYSAIIGVTLTVVLMVVLNESVRSTRISNLLGAWLIYMLMIALRKTNPRPEDPPATEISHRHQYAVLVLYLLGVFNDPLFSLYAPALLIGLWLSRIHLPLWQWIVYGVMTLYGGLLFYGVYISDEWSFYSAQFLMDGSIAPPYLILNGWRNTDRWIILMKDVANQYTLIGALISLVGIARFSRWHPPISTMLLFGYGSFYIFGLMYFGQNQTIYMIPLLGIQIIWLSYGVHSIGQWILRYTQQTNPNIPRFVTGLFLILPIVQLGRIIA
ncbi:MAG: hypothetical protein ACOYLB_02885 [Phototrophicaceae bacterium]